jgi:hypothetical protein
MRISFSFPSKKPFFLVVSYKSYSLQPLTFHYRVQVYVMMVVRISYCIITTYLTICCTPTLFFPYKLFFLYVGMLISLWVLLFPIFPLASQPKEFFLDGLKKLVQRSHKCVELRGEYINTFLQSHSLFSL